MRILEDRKLKNIVLVDNAVVSFAYQIDNGIPILPFYEDKEDTEFLVLMELMDELYNVDDCRDYVSRAFKIREIMNTNTDSYAHLYDIPDDDDEDSQEDPLDVILKCNKSLTLGLKKSISEPKNKLKKKKKTKRSFKHIKKVSSVCVTNFEGMETKFSSDFRNSQK